jgi:aminopeptidase
MRNGDKRHNARCETKEAAAKACNFQQFRQARWHGGGWRRHVPGAFFFFTCLALHMLCLPRAPRVVYLLARASLRSMSHDAYLVPIDPSTPSSNALPAIASLWVGARPKDKAGETRLFHNVDDQGRVAAAISLGTGPKAKTPEALRKAVGTGVKKLRDAGASSVLVDAGGDLHTAGKCVWLTQCLEWFLQDLMAAVGAHLALFKFNHLKTAPKDAVPPVTVLPPPNASSTGEMGWDTGVVYASAQNLSRELMELPANILTPTAFCERIKKEFEGVDKVEIKVRDKGA